MYLSRTAGCYQVITPNYTEEVVLIATGGNHCHIYNKGHVLFDGYRLEGYKVFEEKAQDAEALCQFAGWEFKRIK